MGGRGAVPDIKVEYSTTSGVDDWQTDLLVPPHYGSPHPHPPRSTTDYSPLHTRPHNNVLHECYTVLNV